MTLTEGKKTDKQLWNTLMIIVHIVTESLCKLETSFKGRFFRRHSYFQKVQSIASESVVWRALKLCSGNFETNNQTLTK